MIHLRYNPLLIMKIQTKYTGYTICGSYWSGLMTTFELKFDLGMRSEFRPLVKTKLDVKRQFWLRPLLFVRISTIFLIFYVPGVIQALLRTLVLFLGQLKHVILYWIDGKRANIDCTQNIHGKQKYISTKLDGLINV